MPPRLQDQTAVAQDFKISSDPPTVTTATDSKTFTYTLRPRHERVRAGHSTHHYGDSGPFGDRRDHFTPQATSVIIFMNNDQVSRSLGGR